MSMEVLPLVRALEENNPCVAEKSGHGLGEGDEAGAAQALGSGREEGLKMSRSGFGGDSQGRVVGIGAGGGDGSRVLAEFFGVIVLNTGDGGGQREAERPGVFSEQIDGAICGKHREELFGVTE
jgi:hypothetical protein